MGVRLSIFWLCCRKFYIWEGCLHLDEPEDGSDQEYNAKDELKNWDNWIAFCIF